MTDESPKVDPHDVAEELLALTMLRDRVSARIADLREGEQGVTSWSAGSKQVLNLPNPDNPHRPLKIGEVRLDAGATVAVVRDRPLWESWVEENMPTEIVVQPASRTTWRLDLDSQEALIGAVIDGEAAAGGFGSNEDMARAALDALEQRGYTLTPITMSPERKVVMPAFEELTLKMSKEAGEPVCPDGQIPAGIEVTTNPGKAYVTATKDDHLRETFIDDLRTRRPELLGVTYTTEG